MSPTWKCDWEPDDLNPGPDCPYCAGEMCARFDGIMPGCQHDRQERHGYDLSAGGEVTPRSIDRAEFGLPCGYEDPFGGPCVLPSGHESVRHHDDGRSVR